MKTKFDTLASLIGLCSVLICLLAVLVMRGRSTTSSLAAHMARKGQEDNFWLEADKSELWYSVNFSSSEENSELRRTFVHMNEDAETKEFIEASVQQADSWLLQTWYNLAKTVLSWFAWTHTDMNGYLQRGSMFVLSKMQFQQLLSHANFNIGGEQTTFLCLLFTQLLTLCNILKVKKRS